MNANQFLLSSQKLNSKSLSKQIKSFYLYIGDGFDYDAVINQNIEIHLLGNVYDWENPQFTNREILDRLQKESHKGITNLINATNKYSGDFIFIIATNSDLFLFNDTAGQREIYYSDDFLHFGSQVKVLRNVCELKEHTDIDAKQYYQSQYFKNNKIHVGDATHVNNVKHLLPNHIINITQKKVERIEFPELKTLSLKVVAHQAAKMLRGYLEAISFRKKLLIGLTAGYDSRVLFAASLGIKNCEYFANQNNTMDDNHVDIVIPQKLVSIFNKRVTINKKGAWNTINFVNAKSKQAYVESLDFPRFLNIGIDTNPDEIIVNGNISEVARNAMGSQKIINANLLSFLKGAPNFKFAQRIYKKWLNNVKPLNHKGYNTLDLFYWEERMGIYQAKMRTEMFALNRNMVTPYNSRVLLLLLLSTKRKHRDMLCNKLYDLILAELSNHNDELLKLPINPTLKNKAILSLKRLKIYDTYCRFKVNVLYNRKCS